MPRAIERLPAWLINPGIGRRIALAMALSLVAIQLQAFAQIWIFARPEIRLVGTRWLAEAARDAAALAFALPAEARAAALRQRFAASDLDVAWSAERPWPESDQGDAPVLQRFVATARAVVAPSMPFVVGIQPLDHVFPFRRIDVTVEPTGSAAGFETAPIAPGAPDVPMFAAVRVALRGPDGSWVSVAPVALADRGPLAGLPITPLMLGGLIICVASIATARRILSPLDRLVKAAGRIGTARTVVPVPTDGLGEFGAVARAFEDVQRRLLGFDAERAQMLAAMSHDLRSALTRLRLAIDRADGPEPDPAALREIEDMQAMVESTLTFAGGAASPGERQPVDLAALLISMVDDATDHGLPCRYAGPDHAAIRAVPSALRRALWNLIENAMRYGGVARVSLETDAAALRVEIADDGPGIPPERVDEAFAPFRRLDPARSAAQPGVGLGLTIARDIIQGHGGTIALRNHSAGGLVVDVTLPAA